jgi:membrane-associated protease RseP (regulator of RpoE activity)
MPELSEFQCMSKMSTLIRKGSKWQRMTVLVTQRVVVARRFIAGHPIPQVRNAWSAKREDRSGTAIFGRVRTQNDATISNPYKTRMTILTKPKDQPINPYAVGISEVYDNKESKAVRRTEWIEAWLGAICMLSFSLMVLAAPAMIALCIGTAIRDDRFHVNLASGTIAAVFTFLNAFFLFSVFIDWLRR